MSTVAQTGLDGLLGELREAWGGCKHGHGHPTVWGAAAAEAVALLVETRTARNDVPDTSLWQEAFSDKEPAPGKPGRRWPGEPANRDVISMNGGLRPAIPI